MLCFSINIQKNTSSKWNITVGKVSSFSSSFPAKMQRALSRFEDVHTIELFSVIGVPSSLRGDFVLKSKRHSPQDSFLREISPRIRQDTENEVQKRSRETVMVGNGHLKSSG